ncbi:RNA polymerase sigma-70 factor (ECF subfamily) [Glaciihabitans tibetensis]|uniref:RNA polymerase sigma-70 factor (ECF subfamily) n=1 Tax=Glaciihabitans tibetensis TaxID=1266600 RepID=A0A2T0VFM9_9MICO|nr:sigma-70 family RNA polymerase sigma factor [Glaciihabitans tibetensis]PRY68976.1 RNA polymerase sigma-70 factor (ECF subfamily) [Glaciihabitans tibetensis]
MAEVPGDAEPEPSPGAAHAASPSRFPSTPPSASPSTPPSFDLAAAFDEHSGALFGFAVNALRDRTLAEDCVQETFLRAWRARDQFSADRASLRTWLFVIARHVIIDVQRSIQRMPRLVPADVLDDTAAAADDPLDRLAVIEGLAKLSPEHRAVLVDVHLEGRSYAEVEATSGVPVATLRSRSFYALRAMRDHLTERKGRNA